MTAELHYKKPQKSK